MSPKIVIILGAGASWGIAPSTADLTKRLREMQIPLSDNVNSPDYNQEPQPLFETLDPSGKKLFEELLAEALTRGETFPVSRDNRWITAFAQGAQAMALEVTKKMQEYAKRPCGSAAPSVTLLNLLGTYATTVASLNWDDLPLHSNVMWYDGYEHTKEESRFDPEFLWNFNRHKHRLLWLHGSIHYNRPAVEELRKNPVDFAYRWFLDAESALHGWSQGLETDPSGHLIPQFPIVTGSYKPAQMFSRPFFDHWSALYKDLLKTEVLMVVGYSGQDPHLNSLMAEAIRYNARLRDVVWINKASEPVDQTDIELGKTLPIVFRDVEYLFPSLKPLTSLHELQLLHSSKTGRRTWVALGGIDELVSQHADTLLKIVQTGGLV